ncbi:MBL fold metallo-hydrolase, partial [Enterococcus faecium]|uniref:MBL fold metallo-hydrolase n=1 Tax=Enterococcus faecium TaxID=1352 RepID=UPI003F8AFBC6
HDADGITVTCLPAVHWSKRGAFDRNRTLWASFAIQAGGLKIWFAGDTGYGPVFREIGREHGPFDYALVPIGAIVMGVVGLDLALAIATTSLGKDVTAAAFATSFGGFRMLADF